MPANLPKRENPSLTTLWVDAMELFVRHDGVAMMRFYTVTPDARLEACRFVTPLVHLRKIADAINSQVTDASMKTLVEAAKVAEASGGEAK